MFDPERLPIDAKSVIRYRGTGTAVTPSDTKETAGRRDDDCELMITAANYDNDPYLVYRVGINAISYAHIQIPVEQLASFTTRVAEPNQNDVITYPGKYHVANSDVPDGTIAHTKSSVQCFFSPIDVNGRLGCTFHIMHGEERGGVVELTPDQRSHLIDTLETLARPGVDYDHIPVPETCVDGDLTDIEYYYE